MDSDSLYYLDVLPSSGYVLNVEQRAALQSSLVILKKNYKFQRVLLWGKMLGLKEDYFIAQGRGEDEIQDKKNLYRMDSDSLYYLDVLPTSGYILNVEQRAALQISLVILKKNYKFHRVLFWGKILGLQEDYFIAQGRGPDEMQDKNNLYSFNCVDWFLLPTVTDCMIEEVSKAAKGRFRGDPSYVYEQLQNSRTGGEVVNKVSEESRLAVAIHQIDEEVSAVPSGAFVRSPHGLVQINRSFGGLSHSQAGKLDNILHFRKPKNMKKKSMLEMADLNPAIDFLDVLSDDIPTGSWSLQFEGTSQVCILRSLLWPGLMFYHVPTMPQHGYIYIGDGMKNLDLPFML